MTTEPQPLTEAELAEYEWVCDAATPGPWKKGAPSWHRGTSGRDAKQPIHHPNGTICNVYRAQLQRFNPDFRSGDTPFYIEETLDDPDAAFIAMSRTAVPRLVAEVRRLRAEADVAERDWRGIWEEKDAENFRVRVETEEWVRSTKEALALVDEAKAEIWRLRTAGDALAAAMAERCAQAGTPGDNDPGWSSAYEAIANWTAAKGKGGTA